MSCSLIQKLSFMPGCRPWDTPDTTPSSDYQFHIPGVSTQSPMRPSEDNAGEFSIVSAIQSSVSKVQANASRLFDSTKSPVSQGEAPAWYDIGAKISAGASAANEALQSTLIKVIVLVVIVGALALFGMAYVQSKGVQFAK